MVKMYNMRMVSFFHTKTVMADSRTTSAHMHQPQIDESTLIAMQHHMAQQVAFSQIPDVVKSVRLTCLKVFVRQSHN